MIELEENNMTKIIIDLLDGIKTQILNLQKYSSEDFLFIGGLFKNYSVSEEYVKDINNTEFQLIISNIIKELQFHDIMRQKLEHIESIDDLLLKELKQRLQGRGELTYTSIIPEIVALNSAQLKLILLEYETVVKHIRINLNKMKLPIASSSPLSINFSNSFSHETSVNNIIIDLIEKYTLISQLALEGNYSRKKDVKNILLKLMETYTMQSERDVFNTVFAKKLARTENNEMENSQENNIEFF